MAVECGNRKAQIASFVKIIVKIRCQECGIFRNMLHVLRRIGDNRRFYRKRLVETGKNLRIKFNDFRFLMAGNLFASPGQNLPAKLITAEVRQRHKVNFFIKICKITERFSMHVTCERQGLPTPTQGPGAHVGFKINPDPLRQSCKSWNCRNRGGTVCIPEKEKQLFVFHVEFPS